MTDVRAQLAAAAAAAADKALVAAAATEATQTCLDANIEELTLKVFGLSGRGTARDFSPPICTADCTCVLYCIDPRCA